MDYGRLVAAAGPRDATAFGFVSALAIDIARPEHEWESDHTSRFACLRRISSNLPVVLR